MVGVSNAQLRQRKPDLLLDDIRRDLALLRAIHANDFLRYTLNPLLQSSSMRAGVGWIPEGAQCHRQLATLPSQLVVGSWRSRMAVLQIGRGTA
jgi:hypothetical protein